MSFITLTTDFGTKDHFVGAVKGAIYSELADAKIVDITHHISPFNITETAYILKNLDVFVKVACFIARGGNLTVIGKETFEFKKLIEIQPKVNQKQTQIIAGVLYIDNYGNVITNISKKMFNDIGKGRNYKVNASRYSFTKIFNKYNEITGINSKDSRQFDGNKLAIFNSAGFLEIAVYRSNLNTVGGASTLLGLSYRDPIIIDFFTETKPEYTSLL
jgi:S-adenosylmethionine hydrolase